jgi:hypothetical protein
LWPFGFSPYFFSARLLTPLSNTGLLLLTPSALDSSSLLFLKNVLTLRKKKS